MKTIKLLNFILFLVLPAFLISQNVSITTDNSAPDASAMLDVKSTNKGMLIPRMTQTQRELIASPATGLLVFQTDVSDGFFFYNGTAWVALIENGTETDPIYNTTEAKKITNAGSGKVITDAERSKLTDDADGSSTNEIQTLALSDNQLTISNTGGNSVTFTGWDINAADDITTAQLTSIGSGQIITNTERTKLTNDADGSLTNEIQTIALSGNQLTISTTGGNSVTFTGWDTNAADDITTTQVTNVGSGQIITTTERTKLNGIDNGADNIPTGTIVPFAGIIVPAGWLLCDGAALNPATYPILSTTLGTAWGNGTSDTDNATTFNIPDLRGVFLRGVSGTSGVDPDTSSTYRTALKPGANVGGKVGSLQTDVFKSHNHTATQTDNGTHSQLFPFAYQGTVGSVSGGSQELFQNNGNVSCGNGAHSHTIAIGSTGQSETRPKNVYVNYIIKY